MRITTDIGNNYLRYWVIALDRLLGWDSARVMAWAARFEAELNDEDSLLYRELPMYAMSILLVPHSVRAKPAEFDVASVASRLENAFRLHDYSGAEVFKYDWSAATDRVDVVLAEYGESLASVRRQYD